MTALTDLNGTFTIDPAHSELGFSARHAMVSKVKGRFEKFEGTAKGDGKHPEQATIEVTIDVASLTTGNKNRDQHLMTADFFDVEQYPTMTFRSTSIEIADEQTLQVTGDLTMLGTTRPVTIPFEFGGEGKDHTGATRIGFEGRTKVNRKDFGLTWNAALETGGVLLSEDIVLDLEVSAVKQG